MTHSWIGTQSPNETKRLGHNVPARPYRTGLVETVRVRLDAPMLAALDAIRSGRSRSATLRDLLQKALAP